MISVVHCPNCGAENSWRDGFRFVKTQRVQRYMCRNCGSRFSEPNQLRSVSKDVKAGKVRKINLSEPVHYLTGDIATTSQTQNCKGRIIEHLFWLQKEGFAENTITRRIRHLTTLAKRGANLLDPDSIKETIAKQQKWKLKTKELAVEAYSCFLKMTGGTWKPPRYKAPRTLPFIPTEKELDQLIADTNKKTATFLQLLKETGARSGEVWMLKWVDLDLEGKTIRITPEKGGNPRSLKMSDRLLAMLNSLPKDQLEVFKGSAEHFRRTYRAQRKRTAYKLKSERIAKITFHTFRHWKATMEYHKTKNIPHVMQLLGHKNIQNTLVYTHLVNFESDEFHTAVADSVEKTCKLIEAGFEYVTGEYNDGGKNFRKPK